MFATDPISVLAPKQLLSAKRGEACALHDVKCAFAGIDDVHEAFARFAAVVGIAGPGLKQKAIRPIRGARPEAVVAMFELEPAGEPFTIEPPPVIGEGDQRPLTSTARSIYLTCLRDARVRGSSALLEFEQEVLLDFEGDELTRLDDQLELDPAIFRAANGQAWIIGSDAPAIRIPEAFNLLGPHTYAFGHWMWEYLPKYIEATMSGRMPAVPVLIDEVMPPSHRRALELLLPDGVEIIELPRLANAVVERLWYSPSQLYMPLREKMNERFRWDFLASPPPRFARLVAEMNRRVERRLAAGPPTPARVYLARRPSQRRRLLNQESVEAVAVGAGFSVLYPQDLSFDDQLRLMRGARFIVAPEGSAEFLAFFSPAGARMCILNHTHTAGLPVLTGFLQEIGVDVRILTGPIEVKNEELPHFADYRIDPVAFGAFLQEWTLAGAVAPATGSLP